MATYIAQEQYRESSTESYIMIYREHSVGDKGWGRGRLIDSRSGVDFWNLKAHASVTSSKKALLLTLFQHSTKGLDIQKDPASEGHSHWKHYRIQGHP